MWFKASAPGSLMLLGEYAVLHGKHALVCAVDKRMTVSLKPRQDNQIHIQSALGTFQTTITKISIVSPFQFVLTTLHFLKKKLPSGCDIVIESEFSDKVGFASSAAVTVALLAALNAWLNLKLSKEKLALTARKLVRKVQGLGSGADVMACVFGGIIGYRAQPFWKQVANVSYPITVVYSGSKTPTVEAIQFVKKRFAKHPKIFQQICSSIDQCALAGIKSLKQKDWTQLGKVMVMQQGLMDALGVNTPVLNNIITEMQHSGLLGAKISGSGLGDCAVGLGKIEKITVQGAQLIQTAITRQGVHCEKI